MKLGSHSSVASIAADSGPLNVTWAIACMRTGVLLGEAGQEPPTEQLENLAATLPEVFGTADPSWLERIAARLDDEPGRQSFGEVLLLSETHVHVIQPLLTHPGVALLAMSPAANAVGLVLSQVHAQVAALESEE
jgi:hypothetical protein